MFKKILFLQDFSFSKEKNAKPTFAKGETFSFRPGVNLLVGDQGCGKSTLLTLLRAPMKKGSGAPHFLTIREVEKVFSMEIGGATRVTALDLEQELGRVGSAFDEAMDFSTQIQNRWLSHGQAVMRMIQGIDKVPTSPGVGFVALIDEPDTGLSPRSVRKFAAALAEGAARGLNFIIACHNPILIASQPEVLSLEHRRWMPSSEFLATHEQDPPDEPK